MSKINVTDINATGTPSHTTALLGDGSWGTVSGGGGGGGGRVLLQDVTISSPTASVPLTAFNNSEYLNYQVEIVGFSTDGNVAVRFSTDGGATYDATGVYDFSYAVWGSGGYDAVSQGEGATQGTLSGGFAASPSAGMGVLTLADPASTTNYKSFMFDCSPSDGPHNYRSISAGRYKNTAAVNAMEFISATGNINSGRFRLYGIPIAGSGGGSSGSRALLLDHTFAGDSELDFAGMDPSTYLHYEVEISNLYCSVNGGTLSLQCSTDGGATYDSGGSSYRYALSTNGSGGGTGPINSGGDSKISVGFGLSNSANAAGSYFLRIYDPSSTVSWKEFDVKSVGGSSDGNGYANQGFGQYMNTAAVNAIKFFLTSGNFVAGRIRIYGILL